MSVSSACRSKLQKTVEFCIVMGSHEVAVTIGHWIARIGLHVGGSKGISVEVS